MSILYVISHCYVTIGGAVLGSTLFVVGKDTNFMAKLQGKERKKIGKAEKSQFARFTTRHLQGRYPPGSAPVPGTKLGV